MTVPNTRLLCVCLLLPAVSGCISSYEPRQPVSLPPYAPPANLPTQHDPDPYGAGPPLASSVVLPPAALPSQSGPPPVACPAPVPPPAADATPATEQAPPPVQAPSAPPPAPAAPPAPVDAVPPAPPPAAPAEPAPPAPPAPSAAAWTVCVASSEDDLTADGVSGRLKSAGIQAQIVPIEIKGKLWYRVTAGSFAGRGEAERFARGQLARLGYASAWVCPRQ
jgi:cell division protein FtsN